MKPEQERQQLRQIVVKSDELVKALDELYPARPPNPNDTEREVWMKAGERRVIERLLKLRSEANPADGRVLRTNT